MTVAKLEPAFVLGEISTDLFGRFDLARLGVACSTLRNMWPSFLGGAYSRAGTAFVGFSKQTGRSIPPRLIPFQFSITQGIALEFGNFYMRPIIDGGFVTDVQGVVTNVTNANPCTVTASLLATGAASATVNTGGISQSYVPLEFITLAGGTFSTAAQLQVTTTELLSAALGSAGKIYAPSDTINLSGGTQTTTAVATVDTTQVVNATLVSSGTLTSLPAGNYTFTGTTGTGTKFTATLKNAPPFVFVIGFTGGSYSVNPSVLNHEPMSGPASGVILSLTMGINTFAVTTAGAFTANPVGGTFTQASTSGSGTGATFTNALMGPSAVTVTNAGIYTNFPSNPVAQASASGTGLGATFTVTTESVTGGSVNNGDWLFFSGVGGTTQLNDQTYIIQNVSGNSFTLTDVYGNAIDSTSFGAYTSGGMVARLYTLTTPYSENDLEYIKWAQSADTMSVCCVNQVTGTEYAAQDLVRTADDDWQFNPVVPTQTISAPTNAAGSASSSGSVDYAYVITAVNQIDGTESIASNIASITSAVDIANTAGSISLTWTPNSATNEYNVYKAEPSYGAAVPVGALFGFAGTAYGGSFVDSNIVADFSQVPPLHQNPFARGQIVGVNITGGGSGSSFTYSITTSTGSGFVGIPIVQSNVLVGMLIVDPGQNYGPNDSISFNNSATGTLSIGPQPGTYPGCASYFQERRAYGYTLNNPDTYWMSQPGSFTNFDFRVPTIDSDSLSGTPWGVEVNGIQWMLLMPAGLLVMTGLSAWLLVGAGSFATNVQPISPSSQDAVPQAFTGASPTVPPIKINYDVLYVTWEGSFYYDLPYQLYALSEPLDITQNSRHLFNGYTIKEHAWAEQPFKLLWAVRDDGTLLTLTFLKAEQVSGWAHHDTQGTWQTVCSVKEPPNDAVYLGAQRQFGTNTAYTIERMDNRQWGQTEDCWCVDCGLTISQPTPNAILTASSATGLGSITGATNIVAGIGFSAATTWSVVDNNGLGPGTGAVPTVTLNAQGGVSSIVFSSGNQGSGYENPALVANDPNNGGSGFSCELTLNNSMTFSASASVFTSGSVGQYIRAGGGIAEVTGYTSGTQITANMLSPIVQGYESARGFVPLIFASGDWTMTPQVSSIYVPQFAGATITGLADGNVIPPTLVPANGTVTLPNAASAVTIGLGFTAQLQSVYLNEGGEPTVQGQRKKIAGATFRLQQSLGVEAGSNQIDGSTLNPQQNIVPWNSLTAVPTPPSYLGAFNALCAPLFTGDTQRIPLEGGFHKRGQVAVQQANPLPLEVLAMIPSWIPGDYPPDTRFQTPGQRGNSQQQ